MKLIFLTHPEFLGNKSMSRFAKLLSEGMRRRGHTVESWSPQPVAYKLSSMPSVQKWLSYFDFFVVFPKRVRKLLKSRDQDTLFVLTDQSLGPWVSLITDRPRVVHCHDFLALRSALGHIQENATRWTGKMYQRIILKGFSKGENFISVSQKTKQDLDEFVLTKPRMSEVVYNGLHQKFIPHEVHHARVVFGKAVNLDLRSGYVLHVGGNMWYKNRIGVVEAYDAWRTVTKTPQPLLLVGAPLSDDVAQKVNSSKFRSDIHCLTNVDDEQLVIAYSGASVFLFPSLGEGFGWPIAEAMAAGTLVITTGEAPMSEVGGEAAYLVPRRPSNPSGADTWAKNVAAVMEKVITLSPSEREAAIERGLTNAKRFDTETSLDQIEAIYERVLASYNSGSDNINKK